MGRHTPARHDCEASTSIRIDYGACCSYDQFKERNLQARNLEKTSRIVGRENPLLRESSTRRVPGSLESFSDFANQGSAIEGAFRQCSVIQVPGVAKFPYLCD